MRLPIALLGATLSLAATTAPAADSGSADATAHLVPMDEMRVPIVDGDRADGTLRVKLVLEMSDADAAAHATATLPSLRAASLGAGLEFARLYASPMTPVDAARLASVMTKALHGADRGVTRVLIVEVAASRA